MSLHFPGSNFVNSCPIAILIGAAGTCSPCSDPLLQGGGGTPFNLPNRSQPGLSNWHPKLGIYLGHSGNWPWEAFDDLPCQLTICHTHEVGSDCTGISMYAGQVAVKTPDRYGLLIQISRVQGLTGLTRNRSVRTLLTTPYCTVTTHFFLIGTARVGFELDIT